MKNHVIKQTSQPNEKERLPVGSNGGGNDFVEALAKCLRPLESNYGFNGYTLTQLRETKPLLTNFLNDYFTVNENGHLEVKDGAIKHGVNILGDGKFYVDLNQLILSLYGRVDGINLRRGFYISYDFDYLEPSNDEEEKEKTTTEYESARTEQEIKYRTPVYNIYEGERNILEDPDSEEKPNISQGNVIHKIVGRIKFDRKHGKFKRSNS